MFQYELPYQANVQLIETFHRIVIVVR